MDNFSNKSDQLIQGFKEELLRWNKQINLVSRQETDDRLDNLLRQCIGGHEAVATWLASTGLEELTQNQACYFDLGSGAGLPGIVWHILLSENFPSLQSYMVEPREKRAWFLQRQNRIPTMPGFEALRGRWGDVFVGEKGASFTQPQGGLIIVSLKALHLDDPAVLSGLNAAFSSFTECLIGKTLLLARYYPPDQSFDSKLTSLLSFSKPNDPVAVGDYIYRALDSTVVSLGPSGHGLASLVLSSYVIEGSS